MLLILALLIALVSADSFSCLDNPIANDIPAIFNALTDTPSDFESDICPDLLSSSSCCNADTDAAFTSVFQAQLSEAIDYVEDYANELKTSLTETGASLQTYILDACTAINDDTFIRTLIDTFDAYDAEPDCVGGAAQLVAQLPQVADIVSDGAEAVEAAVLRLGVGAYCLLCEGDPSSFVEGTQLIYDIETKEALEQALEDNLRANCQYWHSVGAAVDLMFPITGFSFAADVDSCVESGMDLDFDAFIDMVGSGLDLDVLAAVLPQINFSDDWLSTLIDIIFDDNTQASEVYAAHVGYRALRAKSATSTVFQDGGYPADAQAGASSLIQDLQPNDGTNWLLVVLVVLLVAGAAVGGYFALQHYRAKRTAPVSLRPNPILLRFQTGTRM